MSTAPTTTRRSASERQFSSVDVPQPPPDVIPIPGTPHPGQAPDTPPEISPDRPPEVIDPGLPGQHAPVGDPTSGDDKPVPQRLH